jgi:lipoprotein NlpI
LTGIRPNSAALIAVLGDVYSELGNVDAAIEAFREAVRLAPTSEIASLGLFHCLWRAKKEREAFDEIRRFMSLSESQDYRDIVNELWEKRVKSRSKAV